MPIHPNLILFAFLAGIAAVAAIGVVAFQSAVRSALCLVLNFFIIAFLYLSLGCEMLGFTQIMVYTGAIMVLFLFVIMLLNLGGPQNLLEHDDVKRPVGIALGIGLATLLAGLIVPHFLQAGAPITPNLVDFGSPQAVGKSLFTDYVFPFEAVSILLLVGVVGSILLAKRRIS